MAQQQGQGVARFPISGDNGLGCWEQDAIVPPSQDGSGPHSAGGPRQESNDGFLLARLASGDLAAFRALVDRHLTAVVDVARRLLIDDAEAEDVAQETMLRLWRTGGSLEASSPGGARPWLRRVATNLCLDRLRARKRLVVVEDVPDTAEPAPQGQAMHQADVAQRVRAALANLPERQRLALTLFHYEGLSQVEIAGMLKVSDEAVESLLARARRALRAALESEWREMLDDER